MRVARRASPARVVLVAVVALVACAPARALRDGAPAVDPRAYASCRPLEAPALERCAYVTQNALCARDDALVPYLRLHYCALAGDGLASGLASGALALTLFAALASVAERFFVPALRNIARGLALRDDVAGATLLSFGNGAPDIFAQIAALSHEDVAESAALAVGAVTGAGAFIASFVFPCVVLIATRAASGRGLVLDKWNFGRDVGFYAVASAMALGFFLDGRVDAREAAALFSLYAAYLFVLLSGRRLKRFARAVVALVRRGGDDSGSDSDSSLTWSDDEAAGEFVRDDDVRAAMLETGGDGDGDEEALVEGDDDGDDGDEDDDTRSTSPDSHRPIVMVIGQNVAHAFKKMEIPLVAALRLTMPELGGEAVSTRHAAALPIGAPLFLLFATGMMPDHIRWVGLSYGIGVSLVCAFIIVQSWSHIGDVASIRALLVAVAFFQSILWMNTAASELVSLLSAIGKVTGVSEALLGATVLAWGNSVGDFVSNTVVAREGNPNMAIAACFAGPLMNLLVGTSFGLLLHIAKYGPVSGYVMPNELILLGGALMFALFYALFVIPFVHKWRVGKNVAYGMIGFYFSFSIVYALTSTHCIFRKPWLGPPH